MIRHGRIAALKFGIAALLGAVLLTSGGCMHQPPGDCRTREQLAAGMPDGTLLSGLRAGSFPGQIVVPDRSNLATGARLTGISCRTRVWRDGQGRFMAHPSFLEQPVQLTARLSEPDFYAGLVDDGTVLVVQQYPGGVAATHTVFDGSGVIVHRGCGSSRGEFLRTCFTEPGRD